MKCSKCIGFKCKSNLYDTDIINEINEMMVHIENKTVPIDDETKYNWYMFIKEQHELNIQDKLNRLNTHT